MKEFLSEKERKDIDAIVEEHQETILSFPVQERMSSFGKTGMSLGFKGIYLIVEDQDGKKYSQSFGSFVGLALLVGRKEKE